MADAKNENKVIDLLIADDDVELLELLVDIFPKNKFRIVTAKDGTEAVFKSKNQSFHVVISDIKMPKKNGISVVQEIQNNISTNSKKTIETKFILISASIDDYEYELQSLPGVKLVRKPFSPNQLLNLVDEILAEGESTLEVNSHKPEMIKLKPGEILITEGQNDKTIYMIKEGMVKVSKLGQTVCELAPGQFIGELSIISGKPRTATVTAITPCVIAIISETKITEVMDKVPKWFKVLIQQQSDRLENMTKLIADKKK
jgi:CRP-like cAMP-binding protein